VNPYDWHFVRGTPYIMRLGIGLRKPKDTRIGVDFAGTVEAVGKDVTQFKPGDEVFGGKAGAFAQYICVSEKSVALKPANISFEEAGTLQIAAMTALQGLRNKAKIQPGQKVLINGASGGVGTFAVQIAKAFGAEVTGVTSTKNVDLVHSIGADHVVDYTVEDFTAGATRYDLILDNVGNHSMARTRRVLAPEGKLISNGGGHANGKLVRTLRTMLVSMFVRGQAKPTVKTQNRDDLVALDELVAAGKIKPVVGGTYPLAEAPAAIGLVSSGHARGTLVISMAPDAATAGPRPALVATGRQPATGIA